MEYQNLEELIYLRLTKNEELVSQLATYSGKPAVFYQTAPDDKQKGWDEVQYPKVVYTYDMKADQDRKTAGTLQVDLFCDEAVSVPEEIVPCIRKSLTNLIVHPEGASHYAFAWASTEMFYLEGSGSISTRIDGATIRFDILEYSEQWTSNPDPAEAVQEFLSTAYKDCAVIGRTKINPFYEPSGTHPAFYVRIISYRTDHRTYALTWIACEISIHVIAPDPESRTKWSRSIADFLNRLGEVTMLDGSPMLITRVSVDNSADYLTQGQITLEAQYTLPRILEVKDSISQADLDYEFEEYRRNAT